MGMGWLINTRNTPKEGNKIIQIIVCTLSKFGPANANSDIFELLLHIVEARALILSLIFENEACSCPFQVVSKNLSKVSKKIQEGNI